MVKIFFFIYSHFKIIENHSMIMLPHHFLFPVVRNLFYDRNIATKIKSPRLDTFNVYSLTLSQKFQSDTPIKVNSLLNLLNIKLILLNYLKMVNFLSTGMVWSQTEMGSWWIWGSSSTVCSCRTDLATGHRTLQQVR